MTVREVDQAPSVLAQYARAVLPSVPGVGSLPGVRHAGEDVPDLTLVHRGVTTDLDRLAAYTRVCGLRYASTLPATYPHLAAFPLQMALMAETSFPFVPMGLVHLRNTITQHRPIAVTETLEVSTHAQDLRPHPKGRLVDLVATAESAGEHVWDERMTLLARGHSGSGAERTTPPLEGLQPPAGMTRWRLPTDLGRRYAAVSGDRNPIHLYAVSAKAFGFPRQIAHGLWTKARSLAAMEGRLPDAYTVEVEFAKPLLLPGVVEFGAEDDGGQTVFGVRTPSRGEHPARTHLVGRVTPAG